ncbi:MAG: endonuclease/exonuclease/phosphatase family protein, partial [bacterium]
MPSFVKNIALAALAILIVGCSHLAGIELFQPANPRLTVLSYNIHHGAGMDGKIDLERIARVIQSVSPDLVSLQEVDQRVQRSGGVDQARTLADLTGMKLLYGPAMDYQGGKYGNAVLSRLPIESSANHPLPGEPRAILEVECAIPQSDTPFTFLATHLDVSPEPRLASIPLIENLFQKKPDRPALLAGDLNALPDSPTLQALCKTWSVATSAPELLTFPSETPDRQIDYVLFRPAQRWKVIEARVLDEPMASDHRPIMAVIEWIPCVECR